MNYFGEIRFATCHTDRKYYSKGLCLSCYRAKMNDKYNTKKRTYKLKSEQSKSAEYVYSKSPIVDIPDMIKDDYWIRYDCKLPKLILI